MPKGSSSIIASGSRAIGIYGNIELASYHDPTWVDMQQRASAKKPMTTIDKQVAQIKAKAKPLKPGETPVPTKIVYLQGDTVNLNGQHLTRPDGTQASDNPVYGKVQVNAAAVLDQGGNIIGPEAGFTLLERVAPDNAEARAAQARGELNTTNGRPVPQESNGLFYDYVGTRDRGAADMQARYATPFDVQVTQTLYVKQGRATLLHMVNKHQYANSGVTSTIGESKPWPKK